MAIDLGDIPSGTSPSPAEQLQIRKAIGVGTTDAPTFLAQTLTGQSLTGTQATSLVDLSATWNTTGTPSAIKLNVTDTASNAASKLMDLQVGGVSRFNVNKTGALQIIPSGYGLYTGAVISGNYFKSTIGKIVAGATNNNLFSISGDCPIAWGNSTTADTNAHELFVFRDAAGILAQRNGTNAQAFRVYNSTDATPATNFDRASFGFTSNVLRIGTENGGTYTTARPIEFVTGGVARWQISAAGHLLSAGVTDGLYDIGASGANRPRNVYVGSSIVTPGATLGGGSGVVVGGSFDINWAGSKSSIYGGATDGVIKLSNYSGSDFNRLQLGGATSAFPAIKRNGTGIDIRLADDSGPAPLTAATLSVNSAIATSAIGIGSAQIRAVSNNKLRFINNTLDNFTAIEIGEADMGIMRGSGTPENIVTAKVGSIYLRTDGTSGSSFYVKESGTGNTGWVAK